jgi:cell division protein FtsL
MSKEEQEREARFKAIQEENEALKRSEAHRKEANETEKYRQEIIRQQAKESFGSGEKAILALIIIIVLGILLGA